MNRPPTRRSWYERGYALDLRSLGIARICVGVILLIDVVDRLRYTGAFASDAGVLPIPALDAFTDYLWPFSIHLLSGAVWWQAALLGITAAAAVALILGVRTWLATVVCWYLIVSMQVRTPHLTYSFDDELAGVLLWAMFIPWGSRFSLDAKARGASPVPDRFSGLGSTGLALHIAFMYLLTGLLKVGPAWTSSLAAIHQALSVDAYGGAVAPLLLDHPGVTRVLTFVVPKLEILGGVLLLVPVRYLWLRIAALLGLAALGIGFATTMRLGLFPYMNLIALIPFVPGAVWDRWARERDPRTEGTGLRATAPDSGAPAEVDGTTRGLRRPPRLAQAFAVIPLVVLIGWCVTRVVRLPAPLAPATVAAARTLQVDPFWYLFAPGPRADDWWMIGAGTLSDGSEIDVLRGGQAVDPRTLEPRDGALLEPRPRFAQPDSFRWIKYRDALTMNPRESVAAAAYAAYLCREWNARHPERRVAEVRLRVAAEDILPTFTRRPRPPVLIAEAACA